MCTRSIGRYEPMNTQRNIISIATLALLTGLAGNANAQLTAPETAPATKTESMLNADVVGQGRLTFLSKTQFTGEILDTEIGMLSYVFKNTGTGPLTVTKVKPACGCTIPELSKKTYAVGESGTLDVSFDPKGKRGAVARSITVFTDSELTPSESLVVRSLVKPVVITEPAVLPFDSIQKGDTITDEFKIYGRTDDFKVTRATVDDRNTFDIEVIDGGTEERDGEKLMVQIIRLTVKDTAKPDNHRAEITVRTNDERKPIFTLAAVARVLGDLKTNPVRVTMGRLTVGDTFEREFHVTSKSGKPFNIKSANANTVAVDATYTFEPTDPQSRTEWVVRIAGTVVNAAPRFNTQLYLTTDVADEEQITVQMYGQLQRQ